MDQPTELLLQADGTYRPPFPKAIDSTMMKAFRSCPKLFEYEYLNHWKSRAPNIHLHAGKAFATGLEQARRAFYEQKLSPDDSVAVGIGALIKEYGTFEGEHDTAKTLPRMCGALEYYFSVYPFGEDQLVPHEWAPGKFGIEFSFASPLPFDNPQTGEPVIYTGRSDMLAEMGGALYIEDDKTTSALGSSWVHSWDMRSQFTGYCWAAKVVASLPVQGVMVRGISILKTKYDHANVITYRHDWEIKRWLEQVVHDLERMKLAWETGYFDYNLDDSCNSYGGCLFRRVCLSNEPQSWLEADYEKRVWDPLAREERPVIQIAQA